MTSIRNFVTGAAVALAIGLGAGAANAGSINLTIPTETAANPAIQQAFHPGRGYLCYMPFYRLVHLVGYYRALRIKYRCNYFFHGHHYH
jgi:hypothetical protein